MPKQSPIGAVHDGSDKWAVETVKAIDAVFYRERAKAVVPSAGTLDERVMYWTLSLNCKTETEAEKTVVIIARPSNDSSGHDASLPLFPQSRKRTGRQAMYNPGSRDVQLHSATRKSASHREGQ
jgi:nitrogen fixation protein FixH